MEKQKALKPSPEETQAAIKAQAPIKMTLPKQSEFGLMTQRPCRQAAEIFGSESLNFVQLFDEPNPFFPDGREISVPFFVTKVWAYESIKAQIKSRIGMRCVLPDDTVCGVSLPYYQKAGDVMPDRKQLLDAFALDSSPIGLCQFRKVDRGQPNPYYALIYADSHSLELAGVVVDKDIPF